MFFVFLYTTIIAVESLTYHCLEFGFKQRCKRPNDRSSSGD